MGAIFLGVNRGKRSVVLDLKRAEARAALLKLVDGADVLMHSIRPQKLRAPSASIPRRCWRAIRAWSTSACTASREDGPYGGMPAYDDIIQGLSGCAGADGAAGRHAAVLPDDRGRQDLRRLVATHAILAALFRRERTGQGGYVEVPMLESMVGVQPGRAFLRPPLRSAARSSRRAIRACFAKHRRPYRTADGYLCACPTPTCTGADSVIEGGMPEAASDRASRTSPSAREHRRVLLPSPPRSCATRSNDEWLERARELEIPASRSQSLEDLVEDPQLRATGYFVGSRDPRREAALARHPAAFQARRPPGDAPAAAPRRAQRRGAARGRLRAARNRRHAEERCDQVGLNQHLPDPAPGTADASKERNPQKETAPSLRTGRLCSAGFDVTPKSVQGAMPADCCGDLP